ncbi:MAG: PKD domain-containing protein [Flavipsychrobacter sp.]|nr:PKD domain-containing protein [Flavipsychrobacter sp.]
MRLRLLYYILLLLPMQLYAQNNIEFIENQGQWDGPFKYKATSGKGEIYLESNCFTYVLNAADNAEKMDAYHHGQTATKPVLNFHAYKVVFEGSNMPLIVGSKPQTTYYNYYLGKDATRWKSNIHPYYDIDYKNVYKGIDMHVSSDKGNMEYEFDVQPDADPKQIILSYKGVNGLRTNKAGNLIISTSVGEMQEMKPYAYQYINDAKVEIACNYTVNGDQVTFTMPDGYDQTQTLVIDPTIVFCTFTGSTADNWGFTATYDDQGDFYAGGIAHSTGYPVSTGAYQITFNGGSPSTGSQYADDIAIMKFNATGTNRIYATYLGGSDNEQPHSLIVDANYNLIVAGRSYSSDFPVTAGAYDVTANGDADIIISKFNSTGTSLLASTYVGGSGPDVVSYNPSEYIFGNLKHNYGDDARSEVQLDRQGNVYVAASTQSTNFPTVHPIQTALSGNQDAVIIKLNSTLTTLLWSTYLGGSSDDAAYVIAFDTSQASIYVAGGTQSSNFPTTAGSFHATYQGAPADGWITKFQNGGTYPIQKSTYIGTAAYDQVYGIQVDVNNNVYTMGQTLGGFPVSTGVYSNPGSSQFIMRLDSNLSTNQLSTVYGSGTTTATNISPVAFLVDTCGNIYISGWGGNLGLNLFGGNPPASAGTTNMPVTSNAVQATTDGNDFYFICLSKNMQNLLYATYFGRNEIDPAKGEHVDGGTSRFDKYGIIYQGICGGCAGDSRIPAQTAFPTQPSNVWSLTDQSGNCNEAALKIAFQFGPVNAVASPNPTSGQGCAPLFVQFSNLSSNGATYTWDFGDGSPTVSTFSASHTYTVAGHYVVKLIVQNSNACSKLVDTGYINITVDSGGVVPLFTIVKLDSCGPYVAHFINTSQQGTASTVYTWNFGDGTSYTGTTPPNHTYSTTGSYTVVLTMTDPTLCVTTDSVSHILTFYPLVSAGATALPSAKGCAPYTVQFQNQSVNGATYQWTFGDGGTSATYSPSHTFNNAGNYTVRLITTNLNSCNKADTAYLTIKVASNKITPAFSYVLPDSCAPYIAIFTDSSKGTAATVYTWNFGDGTTYTGNNPPPHTYATAGTYTVTLSTNDTTACNALDTVAKTLKFNGIKVAAGFTSNDTACVKTDVNFGTTAENATIINYYFGNGQSTTGNATNTLYQFQDTGLYTIIQVVINSASCNGTDTFRKNIYIINGPVADFSVSPTIPVTNLPVTFSNLSIGAVRYAWDFGDNTGSTEVSPTHLYKRTGQYNACLTAYNRLSCPSKLCKATSADIRPLADLPTAFSPNGDGANDILYVRGAAIQTMDLMIFNRWGQLVFETTSQDKGWDGTYNGKPQEMDAYAYVLRVTFIDGTTLQKKGNVTLLR